MAYFLLVKNHPMKRCDPLHYSVREIIVVMFIPKNMQKKGSRRLTLAEKLNDKMKFLITDPIFLEEIAQLRSKWHIDQTGFKTNMEVEKWRDWLYKSDDDVEEFLKDQEILREKYDPSPNLKLCFKHYLLTNKIGFIISTVIVEHNLVNNRSSLLTDPRATSRDYAATKDDRKWVEQKISGKVTKRYRIKENKIDSRIAELKRENKKASEIAKIINHELGTNLTYSIVNLKLHRNKKRYFN